MINHENKVAVVTGAGGGMGLNIAQDLLTSGAAVTLIDVKPQPDGLTANANYCQGDLIDAQFIADTINNTFAEHGRLDYLVNVAGVLWLDRDRSFLDMDMDDWDQVMAINLKAMILTARSAIPLMQKTGGGAMVHFSTIQCLRGDNKPQDAYQASKAGVIAFSKSVAVQFGKDNIRSNTILPGPTYSPMQVRWDSNPAGRDAIAACAPLGRVGATQDMSNACSFLLSDAAAYITGTELIVDGGLTALPAQ